MKRYKIGRFAKEMGVTQDLVKHYEKYGILAPEKDEQSHYRYYSIRQGEKIIESRFFRNLGFTLRECAQLIYETDLVRIRAMLREKKAQLERDVEQKNRYIAKIDALEHVCGAFDAPLSSWQVTDLPGFYFLRQTQANDFCQDEETLQRVHEWIECLPLTAQALLVPAQTLLCDSAPFTYEWGLSVDAVRGAQLGLNLRPPVRELPAGKYLSLPITIDGEKPMDRARFAPAAKLMRCFSLPFAQDALCECVLKSHENAQRRCHYLIHIPLLLPRADEDTQQPG